jgi:phycocyanin alpha chain
MAVLNNKKVIATAKAQERLLTTTELAEMQKYFQRVEASIAAASKLSTNAESLTRGAAKAVLQKFPIYAFPKENVAKCIRDIDYYLRFITYCLVAGDTSPLDEYVIKGMRETYRAFNLSPKCSLEALKYIKANHGLTGRESIEADAYIEYLMNTMKALHSEVEYKRQKSEDIEIFDSLEQSEIDLGVEHDIAINMPPISRRKVLLHIRRVSTAKPKVFFDQVTEHY